MGDRSEQDGDHLFSASEQPDDEYPVWTLQLCLMLPHSLFLLFITLFL
jgi:hypothetical protein